MEYVKEDIVWEYVDCDLPYAMLVNDWCSDAEWDLRPSTRCPSDSSERSESLFPISGPSEGAYRAGSSQDHRDLVPVDMRFG